MASAPLFLVTDFGLNGPYVGQLHAAVLSVAAQVPVIDLMHDMPSMRPDLAAYLLPAICRYLPERSVIVAVVDPGVGGARLPVIAELGGRRFVGPDNGLFSRLEGDRRVWRIDWRPPALSNTFHGRDLFAPVGARLAAGLEIPRTPVPGQALIGDDWTGRLERVVYVDDYGNAMLGIPAQGIDLKSIIRVGGQHVSFAPRFGAVAPGTPFWYRNSVDLVEIAVNGESAAARFSLVLGDPVAVD